MIFEEISGDVKAVLNGKTLAIGDTIEDAQWPLVFVIGKGKVIFRVDSSSTAERAGTEPITEPITPEPTPVVTPVVTPAPVEAAPVAEQIPEPVEAPSPVAEEEPAKK